MIHNDATYHTWHPQSNKNHPSTPQHQGLKSRSHHALTKNQPLEVDFCPLKMRICTKVHNALTRENDTFPHIPKHPKIPRATMHTKTHPKNLKNVIITTKTPVPKTQTTQFTSKIYIKPLKNTLKSTSTG